MNQLAFDFEVDAPEWAPIYKTLGNNLISYIRDDLCRDCGAKANYNQGGAGNGGAFMVCDACAQIDNCRVREHNPVVERRAGQFGIVTDQAAHCQNCGWWLSIERWDDAGVWRELTADEVLDLCAEHAIPKHTSHWGMSHPIADHDRLVVEREKRRQKFRSTQEVNRDQSAEGHPARES